MYSPTSPNSHFLFLNKECSLEELVQSFFDIYFLEYVQRMTDPNNFTTHGSLVIWKAVTQDCTEFSNYMEQRFYELFEGDKMQLERFYQNLLILNQLTQGNFNDEHPLAVIAGCTQKQVIGKKLADIIICWLEENCQSIVEELKRDKILQR